MKRTLIMTMALWVAAAGISAGDKKQAEYTQGLVAHYFFDATNWNGIWPDTSSIPGDNPDNWTFSAYRYSRIEPVVNHMFVNKGWFSVRWCGVLKITGGEQGKGTGGELSGAININPGRKVGNSDYLEIDGGAVTIDTLRRSRQDLEGKAQIVVVTPKGNANRNGLLINEHPFPLQNGTKYTFKGDEIAYRIYNDRENVGPSGHWWLSLKGANITVSTQSAGKKPSKASKAGGDDIGTRNYVFEILADDGCRLFIDGKPVITDWKACWEKAPAALRRSEPIALKPGNHDLVVEYFQGQSLSDGDADPMRLFWSTTDGLLARQIVPPKALMHSAKDRQSSLRKQ